MKPKEASKLKVGDRVMWDAKSEDQGSVIEQGYCATKIKWDDGQVGIVHHNDFAPHITRAAQRNEANG